MYETMIFAVFYLLFLVIILIVAFAQINKSSKTYRRTLSDLYVASKIRTLAKEDGLDLAEEYESFKAWIKKQRINNQSLDYTIEEELQERISKTKNSKEEKKA